MCDRADEILRETPPQRSMSYLKKIRFCLLISLKYKKTEIDIERKRTKRLFLRAQKQCMINLMIIFNEHTQVQKFLYTQH